MKKIIFISFFLLFIMLVSMSFQGFSNTNTTSKNDTLPSTVKIGFLYPATGALGAIGSGLMAGAQAAAYRINSSSSYGFKVQIVAEDTATDGPTTATATQTLIADGVQAIVGAASSTDTLAAAAVTIPNRVVLISYGSTNLAITTLNDSDYVFRDVASDAYQGQALVNLTLHEGVTHPFILFMNNAYGNGVANQFISTWNTTATNQKTGYTIAGQLSYDPTSTSYASELATVQAASPDGVVMISYTQDGVAILDQAKNDNINFKFLSTDAIADPSVTNATGLTSYLTGKLFGTIPSAAYNATNSQGQQTTLYSQYINDLASTHGTKGIYGDYAYDTFLLVAAALKNAGTNSGTAIRDSLYTVANGFEGATNPNKAFNCAGEPISQTYDFWNATNGAVLTQQAHAVPLTNLGATATAPCLNYPYTGTFITSISSSTSSSASTTSTSSTSTTTSTSSTSTTTSTSSTSTTTSTSSTNSSSISTTPTTSNPTSTSTISTSPGFEFIPLFSAVLLIEFLFRKKKR